MLTMNKSHKYKHREYKLTKYDPKWKERFLEISRKIKSILGENVVEIDHIGSTSIKGMVGKSQIDVLVVVKDLAMVDDFNNDFTKNGFTVLGRGYVADDDYYVTEDSLRGVRLSSVHILQEGNQKINERKIFRDYLEINEADRELYIATKKKLYSQYSDNYPKYVAEKKDVIIEIAARAKEWAQLSG